MNKDIDAAQRVKLLKAIERFIFIVFLLDTSRTLGDKYFYQMAYQLKNGEKSIDEIIDHFNNMSYYGGYYFKEGKYLNTNPFKTYIEKLYKNNSGGFYGWKGLRYFLYEYELAKVVERGNKKINWTDLFGKKGDDNISIEHIYPQTPDDPYWRTHFKGYKEENKQFLQGSLGNLLLLSQRINAQLQNNSFEDKKKGGTREVGYNNGSHSEIEVSKYKEWNPESILDRGIKLLKFMGKRWNLKFENEKEMREVLFLGFLKD